MIEPISPSSRGGCLIRAVLMIAVLGLVVVAGWIVLLPGIIVSTVQARTGFVVKIEQMSFNPFAGKLNIEAAVIENPIGWPTHEFLTLRRFKCEAEVMPLFRHRFVADEVVVDVQNFSLVRNREGVLNTEAFRNGIVGTKAASPTRPDKSESAKTDFLIRHLVLKFDRLVVADYSGSKPLIKEYDLNIVREMRGVDSIAKLISPFVGVALDATGKNVQLGAIFIEWSGKHFGTSWKENRRITKEILSIA